MKGQTMGCKAKILFPEQGELCLTQIGNQLFPKDERDSFAGDTKCHQHISEFETDSGLWRACPRNKYKTTDSPGESGCACLLAILSKVATPRIRMRYFQDVQTIVRHSCVGVRPTSNGFTCDVAAASLQILKAPRKLNRHIFFNECLKPRRIKRFDLCRYGRAGRVHCRSGESIRKAELYICRL